MRILWSRAADQDVANIYSYLEPRSHGAARAVLRSLFNAVDLLAEMPRLGAIADLRTEREYRYHVVEHYKIFYFLEAERLVISRVWDVRRDPETFFISRG